MKSYIDIDGGIASGKLRKFKLVTKFGIGIISSVILLFVIAVVFLAISKNQEINSMQEELRALRRDIDMLKYHNNFLDEIKAFEKEDYPEPNLPNEDGSTFLNDIDVDYGSDYESNEEDNSETTLPEHTLYKREILSTMDGVPILPASYADTKRQTSLTSSQERLKLYDTLGVKSTKKANEKRNHSKHRSLSWTNKGEIQKSSSPTDTETASPIMKRTSRVMQTNEDKSKAFRRLVKKSVLKSGAGRSDDRKYQEQVESSEATVISSEIGSSKPQRRKHRHRHNLNLETMDERNRHETKRITPAIHFNGDSSKYINHHQPHYEGNGRLKHPHGYIDWTPASWAKALGTDRFFQLHNEHLTVKETGLYFIYAQIFYSDAHDTNGYKIVKNQEMLAQCTTTSFSNSTIVKGNTCYTATVDYLTEGDVLKIKDIGNVRISLFEPGKSFFGLVRVSDMKIK